MLPARALGDDREAVIGDGRWGKGLHGERIAGHPVDQQSGVGGISGKVRQVLRMKLAGVFAELFGEDFRVVRADLEGDDRTDVAEHGIGGRIVQLLEVLMGDGQAQAILASLAQDRSERAGREVLELVDVEIEVATLGFGDIGSGHGGLLDGRDEKGSQQRGVVFADTAFAQVDDQHFALVHDFSEVERSAGLADDRAHRAVGQEWPNLVLDRRDSLGAIAVVPTGELVHPKAADHVISNLRDNDFAIASLGEQSHQLQHRAALFHGREHRIAKRVLQPWSPRIVELLERGHDARRDLVDQCRITARQRIERHGEVSIPSVKQDHVVGSLRWHHANDAGREVAVRINETDAVPRREVRMNLVQQQSRLAHAGLADDIQVPATIFFRDADDAAVLAKVDAADDDRPVLFS